MIKKLRGVLGCVGALALGACHSATTRIYTLEVAAPATRLSSYQAPALRVDSLSVPAGWDRIEILRPSAAGKLEISDFDHWSAPLGHAARQVLSADLSARLPPGSVIYPRLPKPNEALGINVDILEFSVAGSRASMQASWVITPTAAGAPGVGAPGAKRSEALLQYSMSSAEPPAVARTWSELIGQLADHIAADAVLFQTPK
jgi:uncharacterized lipoprotein YmbA